MVKVVMLEESLLQGIEGEFISVYTVKSIFDRMKKTSSRIITIQFDPNRSAICLPGALSSPPIFLHLPTP